MRSRLCSFARSCAAATATSRRPLKLWGSAEPRSIAASKNMAYERNVRRRKPLGNSPGVVLLPAAGLARASSLPASFYLAAAHLGRTDSPAALLPADLSSCSSAAALIEGLIRPLQTLSNVVSSLREGDYSFRARGAASPTPLVELAAEINALADLLQKQRVRSLEATALLARILEVMHAPLFAFDREDTLATRQQRRCPAARSSTWRAALATAQIELGLEVLLGSADQTIHSFASKPTRWLLRKALFRQDGAPHTLLLLADVSQPLQEEEQIAWKRLIRVLGHELSNSLAPIKSIAGSLLARAEQISGDEATVRDFRRGLGVVESRADALHRFVQSYRLLAQLPPPHLKPFRLGLCLNAWRCLSSACPFSSIPDRQFCSTQILTSSSRCLSTC